MTRLLALLVALALTAVACGGGDATATGDSDSEPTTTEAETTTTVAETTTTEAETTTTEAEAEPEAEPEAEAVAVDGQVIYESNCTRCHGIDGIGTRGPDLIGINENVPDMQVSFDQIVNGGGGMPAFGSRLSEDEIQATVDYVYATF